MRIARMQVVAIGPRGVVGACAAVHWRDGRWEPNRTCTWVRRPEGATPCLSGEG